jgi:tRNA dimethylallyltransferase
MSSSGALAGGSLRVITGPTGSGKSALVMALAADARLTVLSADSRQLYRGFDIGTAKPTAAERARVPHEGIDIAEPSERFSAAAWAERATGWIAAARTAGRVPVAVGGTGFYLRALTRPLFAEPPLDPARRAALATELGALSTAELRRRCERADPARAHLGRAQLLRALEVASLTGEPISAWHARAAKAPRRSARYLLVDPGPVLREWIVARVRRMLDAGWMDEVAALARRVPDGAPAWNAAGYAVIRDLVRGRLSREEAAERVVIATRQYAKRQRTWFRHQLPAERVTMLDPLAGDALDRARRWWDAEPDGGDAA